MNKIYIAIDLKSFYASVECVARGLDPLTTNLVVADPTRTEKTICLAVTPSLKALGIPGRPRLFEVVQKVRQLNYGRKTPVTYIVAPPRMALYMKVSTQVYNVYLKYISPDDIHIYSIDEVFIDATNYLSLYHLTAHELAMKMVRDVLKTTGVTATAGIGTNLYLAKIAMDIVAKKMPADKDGVRIAELDEKTYREKLWSHQPITDFWRVGKGYAKKLAEYNLFTMGDIALCSNGDPNNFYSENLLYKLFGINAELLIDHAWGWEPCTIQDIKNFRPQANSISSGQVLQSPYTFEKGLLVIKEMTDLLVLDLVDKNLVTNQMVINVGYDIECLTNPKIRNNYHGEIETDGYGRLIPKAAHGSINLKNFTSSTEQIMQAVTELYNRIVDKNLLVRRMNVVASHVMYENDVKENNYEEIDLFSESKEQNIEQTKTELAKERNRQKAILSIQKKYGKNALLKGMNYEEGATGRQRNGQIGGHKA